MIAITRFSENALAAFPKVIQAGARIKAVSANFLHTKIEQPSCSLSLFSLLEMTQ
jgi:hypothetical protein